jgi:alpha-tubulin suppressor-like RCC1 family protein
VSSSAATTRRLAYVRVLLSVLLVLSLALGSVAPFAAPASAQAAPGPSPWAWGYNSVGQLGDGTNTIRFTPVQVRDLTGVVALAGGQYHSLALKGDGTVWAWGSNSYGQLGDGTWTTSFSPVPVSSLSGVIAIAGGERHSLALKSDGTVWAWGWNSQGQLGDGTLNSRSSPFQVPGIAGATAVATSFDHSMALLADGSVRVWGGGSGKMGDGTPNRSLVPITPVGMNADVIGIAGGYYHSLFLKSDRKVWGCGLNTNGQLGFETYQLRYTPVELPGLADIRRVIVGHSAEHSFTLAPGVPPAFSLVLGSETATVGDLLIWTTVVNGTPPLAFEWRLDGAVLSNGGSISGATSSGLTINPVMPEHEGEYTCTVTNPYGSASITRTLTVNCIPADFNCDGRVDENDLGVLANCAAGPGILTPPPGCTPQQFAAADADGDGDVDQDDFGRFQRCFAGPDQLPTPGCGQ